MAWVQTESGGFVDTDQEVPWEEMLAWELELYLRSCWLYYHSDLDPVLSDALHDRGEQILQAHFDELPDWFKDQVPGKQLKPAAHALVIPEDVQQRAVEWHKQCMK